MRVLAALDGGCRYGFEVIQQSAMHSATVYRALRRLEELGLVRSAWEEAAISEEAPRPRRRYYRLTPRGRDEMASVRAQYRRLLGDPVEPEHA